MNETSRIGLFVGFGEAGYHLAKGLRQAGIEHIAAYDIQNTAQIRQRAAETQTTLVASNADLAAASDIIFSTVNVRISRRRSVRDRSAPVIAASLRRPKLRLTRLRDNP